MDSEDTLTSAMSSLISYFELYPLVVQFRTVTVKEFTLQGLGELNSAMSSICAILLCS